MTTEQTTSHAATPGGDSEASISSVHPPCRDLFDRLTPHGLIERYRLAVQHLDPRVLDLDDTGLDRWFGPEEGVGSWSCRALLTHLMDTELLFTMRIRRVLAEDCPVFENWDEQAFLDSRLSRPGPEALLMPPGALIASAHTLRQTLATVLVQLTDADWERPAMSAYLGEVTLRRLIAYACWHFEHHAAFLGGKVTHLLGPAPEGEGWGGCGEGCSCAGSKDQPQE
jgi:hypothetical protein